MNTLTTRKTQVAPAIAWVTKHYEERQGLDETAVNPIEPTSGLPNAARVNARGLYA